MEYSMELIFYKSANMNDMFEHIYNICEKTGCTIMENKDNRIIYGADDYEKFGPAFVHLSFDDKIKKNLIEAIWDDEDEGPHSCKKNLFR